MDDVSESKLEEIANRAAAATPGPWFVQDLDDDHAMSLIAVSTCEEEPSDPRWPAFDHGTMK